VILWSKGRRDLGKVLHVVALLLLSPLVSLGHGHRGPTDLCSEPAQPPRCQLGEPRSISGVLRSCRIPLRVPTSPARSPAAAEPHRPTPQTGSSASCNEISRGKELFWLLFASLADLHPSGVVFCWERGGTRFKSDGDTALLRCSFGNPPAGTSRAATDIKRLALKSHQFLSNSPGLISPLST